LKTDAAELRLRNPFKHSKEQLARKVAEGLTKAFDPEHVGTVEDELDLGDAKVVIFSDHHRGTRDGADDFRRCEPAYCAALAWYLAHDFELVALGDVEELWENAPGPVMDAYDEVVALESEFHQRGKYRRFWGNHDLEWESARMVAAHIGTPDRFPGIRVCEALRWRVVDKTGPLGMLFLVHGHQGTLSSDRFAAVSRPFVRHVWRRFQRAKDLPSTAPSRDWALRGDHEDAMLAWAARRSSDRVVLITGHTHRPVFWRGAPPAPERADNLQRRLDELRASGTATPDQLGDLRLRVEALVAESRRHETLAKPVHPPCFFNTGCCSFGDGDITGLEIASEEIRLVRWAAASDEGEPGGGERWRPPRRVVLERARLSRVFDEVGS